MAYQVHETAIIDEGAKIGDRSKIWQWVHVCSGAYIGSDVSLGLVMMTLYVLFLAPN